MLDCTMDKLEEHTENKVATHSLPRVAISFLLTKPSTISQAEPSDALLIYDFFS